MTCENIAGLYLYYRKDRAVIIGFHNMTQYHDFGEYIPFNRCTQLKTRLLFCTDLQYGFRSVRQGDTVILIPRLKASRLEETWQ